MKKILLVFGTRPESIKMAPLVHCLKAGGAFNVQVCVTAQHREMLDQVLSFFEITPDYDLDLMKKNQSLAEVSSSMLSAIDPVLKKEKPDIVLVHGDTATTLCTSLACFYLKIPVGHVEAGLRTGNIYSPWPEEFNRKATSLVTKYHFAPTLQAKQNLLAEGVKDEDVFVCGNTVIDALLWAKDKIEKTGLESYRKKFSYLDPNKKLILVTGHRRENFGKGFENICEALLKISEMEEVEIVYPVHLNPNVKNIVEGMLGNRSNIHLIAPQDYPHFVYLMDQSYLILSDSGGIQEEAPALGKPVLVLRDTTERPEAIEAGTVKLVGSEVEKIYSEAKSLVTDQNLYKQMSEAKNPFGDGTTSQQISDLLKKYL